MLLLASEVLKDGLARPVAVLHWQKSKPNETQCCCPKTPADVEEVDQLREAALSPVSYRKMRCREELRRLTIRTDAVVTQALTERSAKSDFW